MIRPNTKPPKQFPITTYDLEWRSHDAQGIHNHENQKMFEVSLCGVYDERGYRKYRSVEDFLEGELTPRNAGRRYYAHFGGASDMVFLLKPFLKSTHYQVSAIFSGSSAILVRIRRGSLQWDFIDSFWLLRVSLKKSVRGRASRSLRSISKTPRLKSLRTTTRGIAKSSMIQSRSFKI